MIATMMGWEELPHSGSLPQWNCSSPSNPRFQPVLIAKSSAVMSVKEGTDSFESQIRGSLGDMLVAENNLGEKILQKSYM
ncbi:hypothetical protein NHQ30_006981 [Ciborinia camelliae]|nr:hypothetical protein NHQ30_006981 [Ciborinia camelliae]